MVEKLKSLKTYKAMLIRRVLILHPDGKKRPLGIPTIKDRCIQQLFKLILEPITETKADPHNFGFRPAKNAHQTLTQYYEQL